LSASESANWAEKSPWAIRCSLAACRVGGGADRDSQPGRHRDVVMVIVTSWRERRLSMTGQQNGDGAGADEESGGLRGDFAVTAGDLAAARAAYQASLDIVARLAAADSASTTWQSDVQARRQRINDLRESSPEPQGR
jgi:hypothetical protein